ncbi:MAG: flavin reductase [Leclercia adecarboxylata]|mgnify:FL=1|uniref:Flavin reductase n=1 Tax=Leclercia adecarboxylata TaxID=83655 RepID=A0AAP9DDX2_9ENTR|nr:MULTISPECIES: flavin reductase [Leclercia]HCN95473.1 flavin reductase [Leclercia sp.]MDU1061742.1 flavin reductase [Leclercia adecarboxylata]MDU4841836.1 flavin reductase [Leclercia adecarboxylata]QDK21053.1 flavin reductase [Leclercia adecarboxylata]QGU15655.1 flavin reductase [Leclercia sp. 119287]
MTLQTEFRNAMAQLGSAVSVITTDGPAGKFGFTASAVCSVTDSPPTLLVCMNRNSFAHAPFRQNGALCVNVLSSDHQDLSGVFANASLRSEQRFAYDSWQVLASGAPVLSSSVASFDCLIDTCHEVGSHSVFYCQVQAIRISETPRGLVYFNRRYHAVGHDLEA